MMDSDLAGARVLVVGLGDIGGTLAASLVGGGAEVTGVRRGASAPAGVELVRADAGDPSAVAALPDGFDAAVLCLTPDGYDEAGYRRGYLAPAQTLAERWRERPPRQILWVSSTAVYGATCGETVDDATAPAPDNFRGSVLLEAEAALRATGAAVTAVRFSGLYGPGRTALIRRALEGRGAPAAPPHYTNRIHRDDAVAVLAFLIERFRAGVEPPPSVIGSDPAPAPRHEVLAWLAAQLGVTLESEEGAGRDRAPSRRLLPSALQGLGYRWRHADYRSGFGAVLEEMRGSGELAALRASAASS